MLQLGLHAAMNIAAFADVGSCTLPAASVEDARRLGVYAIAALVGLALSAWITAAAEVRRERGFTEQQP